jgi:hypothetical protein
MLFQRDAAPGISREDSRWDYLVISSEGPISGSDDLSYAEALQFTEEALADMLGFVVPPRLVDVWTVHSRVRSSTWSTIAIMDPTVLFTSLQASDDPQVVKEAVQTVPHPHIAELLRADVAATTDDDLD